ncbi:SPFH domain-containing protein [Terrabacter sp. Root181]|uniref:SPFH domain-containing protein n=1 Tax=Terrabacter sp. Root181 TaxID=1736484 RepID=UPI0035104F0E
MTVPAHVEPTAALFPAVPVGTNTRRGSNTQGSSAIVTNGSKIVVPEGYGLLLFQEGELTAFANEPGGYIWNSEDVNSQTLFAGDSWSTSLVKQSWERFQFGGRPGAQQLALFVNLKELPNNRFGTQSVIYWDDAYFNAQVGVLTHGTYSLNIVDPIVFVKQFVPATYLQAQAIFDFTDTANAAANQLFSEVVGSLSAAFSSYANHTDRRRRITNIQQDSLGFAEALSQAVQESYRWKSTRGLMISKVSIVGIDYDEHTRELLRSVQRADALGGTRGNSNFQASVAAGMEAAGETDGAGGILGMGIAAGSVGLSSLMQAPSAQPIEGGTQGGSDLVTTLEGLKRALEAGLIDQSDFDAAKAKALGLS